MLPQKRSLQSLDLHPSRGVAPSGLPPLWKIPHCCLPQEYGPCLSSIVADHPLRPATRHRLGELLPHQLADRPQVPPLAINLYSLETIRYYSSFRMAIPDQRADTNVLLTRSPLSYIIASYNIISLDLHVLGAPLAFILSQDQTLLNLFIFDYFVYPSYLLTTRFLF